MSSPVKSDNFPVEIGDRDQSPSQNRPNYKDYNYILKYILYIL